MKEFYKDFKTFVNESKNGTLNKKSERINEAITYTISKDELKKFMVPATVKLISTLEAGKEMITAQSDNFEAYIVKVIDADTFELKPAMDVFKKKKSENVTPEREEGYEEEDDSTNDEELELEEMEDSEEVETEEDDEPKFESFVNEKNESRIEYKTLELAKKELSKLGAVEFKGTTDNSGLMTGLDNDGDKVGSIYSSYDENFKKVFVVGLTYDYPNSKR